MAANDQKGAGEKPKKVISVSPAFASYYANETQVQVNSNDVTFSFSVASVEEDENSAKTAHVQRVAEVRMSPQHAIKVVKILTTLLNSQHKVWLAGLQSLTATEEPVRADKSEAQ